MVKIQLSPRSRRYGKRFGIAGAVIGFLPLGLRATMMVGDFILGSPDPSDFGGVAFWTGAILLGAIYHAAIVGAIGVIIGIGVAQIVGRIGKRGSQPSDRLGGLSPRVKRWAMWGALVCGSLAAIAGTYLMIWPIAEVQDPGVEALPAIPRAIAHVLQLLKDIVFDGAVGAAFGAGAGAIANRFSERRRQRAEQP